MEDYKLNNNWILWFHHPNDNNWSEESYIKVAEITSIKDFWMIVKTIPDFLHGMFFLMRSDVFPRWEDINNLDGGYWTFRILKKDADKIWQDLMKALIGETLTERHKDIDGITGISISPKVNNCILKIWNKNAVNRDIGMLCKNIPGLNYMESMYRKHQDHENFQKEIIIKP